MKRSIIVTISLLAIVGTGLALGINIVYHRKEREESRQKATVTAQNNFSIYNYESLHNLANNNSQKVQESIKQIQAQANELLNLNSYESVTQKTKLVANGETKNDYASMCPYLWEDNTSESGYIVKDGVDNPQRLNSQEYDFQRLQKMVGQVNTLTMAYAVTGNNAYVKKASDILYAWFLNPDTKMNPNMKYAQIFVNAKGQVYYSGSSMISAMPLLDIVNDMGVLQNSTAWSKENSDELKLWFGQFAYWLETQNEGGIDALRINNHGTWLLAELAEFNLYAGNVEDGIDALKSVGNDAIYPQIQGSGKIPSALIRTKSEDYTEYNLQAFITLAVLGEKNNIDIWNYKSPEGGSIYQALDYLTKYLINGEWPYQQISGKDVNNQTIDTFLPYLGMAYAQSKNNTYLNVINKYSNNLNSFNYLLLESYMQ